MSGKYDDYKRYEAIQGVYEDCQAAFEAGVESVNFLVDKAKAKNDKVLMKGIAKAAGKPLKSLFPDFFKENVKPAEVLPVELAKCTLMHDSYSLVNYATEERAFYFEEKRKWHNLKCRCCKELLREKNPKPTDMRPNYICRNEYVHKAVCDDCVCPDCWVSNTANIKSKRSRRTVSP